MTSSVSVALLHDQMVDKNEKLVTTSVTLIDIHDISRSSRTYGMHDFFIVHPAETVRNLVKKLTNHWEEGFGATYNPNRKDALECTRVVPDLDQAIAAIETRTGVRPKLVATSARGGDDRISSKKLIEFMTADTTPYLIMFGTGWGMSPQLLARADYILEPINGPTPYNHLSVRSAVAIVLDRLFGV